MDLIYIWIVIFIREWADHIKINDRNFGSVAFRSEKWAAASLTIPQGHPHAALCLTVTEGNLDILSLHFSPELNE